MYGYGTMVESFEEHYGEKLPKRKIVCPRCDGEGTHVNPAVDGHGITADEWAEWGDDEREGYLTGRYDVACEECDGRNVIDEVDENRLDVETRKRWRQWVTEEIAYRAEMAAEMRMGA